MLIMVAYTELISTSKEMKKIIESILNILSYLFMIILILCAPIMVTLQIINSVIDLCNPITYICFYRIFAMVITVIFMSIKLFCGHLREEIAHHSDMNSEEYIDKNSNF